MKAVERSTARTRVCMHIILVLAYSMHNMHIILVLASMHNNIMHTLARVACTYA